MANVTKECFLEVLQKLAAHMSNQADNKREYLQEFSEGTKEYAYIKGAVTAYDDAKQYIVDELASWIEDFKRNGD